MAEKEKPEKLLTVVHQTITTVAKTNLEKIVKKEIANTFANLEKVIPATVEATVSKVTLEQMKKVALKTDSMLKSTSETIASNVKNIIVSEGFEGVVKSQIDNIFVNYFQNILIPIYI